MSAEVWISASKFISFTLQVSTTTVTSGMVTEASATFVAITILISPLLASRNTAFCSLGARFPCSGMILNFGTAAPLLELDL